MRIHRQGYRILIISFLLLGLINLAFVPVHHAKGWFFYTFLSLSFIFFLLLVAFFRKPNRKFVLLENSIYSPADGTIVAIEEIFEDQFFKEPRLQVSIFMSPLNVHLNYCPISGLVEEVKYDPGKYFVAWHPKSSTENERTAIIIRQKSGKNLLVRQIAGAMARRIVTFIEPGTQVEQGQELGFIKFGSRVDVLLPVEVNLQVKLDQRVKGNSTILGTW